MKRLNIIQKIFGRRYRIVEVDKGLKDNEILVFFHTIFIKREGDKR